MIRPKREYDLADLRRRLEAGEWLPTGAVNALFKSSHRWAADNWINAGKIGFKRTPGRQRLCNPDDVLKLLSESEEEHRS